MNKEFKKALRKYKYASEGGRGCYSFSNYIINKMYCDKGQKWKIPTDALSIGRNHNTRWYYLIKKEDQFDSYIDDFLKRPHLLKEMELWILEKSGKITKSLEKDLSALSNKELTKLFLFFYKNYKYLMYMPGVLRHIDHSSFSHFKKVLKGKENLIETISVNKKPSFALKEKTALLKLALKLKKERIGLDSRKALSEISKIYDNYCWSTCGYYNEEPKTLKSYILTLRMMIKEDPKKKLIEIKEKTNKEKRDREKIIDKLSKKDKLVSEILAEAIYLKDFFKFYANKVLYESEALFKEIAKRTKLNLDFIKDLYPKEIVRILENKKIDKRKVLKRIEKNILYTFEGKLREIDYKEIDDFDRKYLNIDSSQKTEFKGRTASRGYAQGRVKVILSKKDFSKLKEGDILVTFNTSPDFVPILKKAKAIVAEEGGLTAHVSVISREMNIPCIVGIANITDYLKNNDLVEVDANNGIIKILKRKK